MPSTSDYLSFLLSFPNYPPISILSLFFLGLFRLAPIVAIAPFLGGRLPGSAKIGLAISLGAILLPQLIATSTHPISFDLEYIGYSLKELFLGVVLAFLASIPFYIAQGAGVLVDFLRGSSALQVQDPLMQTQASPIGLLYNYILVVVFYQIDGPFLFLDSVFQSYHVIPADAILPPAFFNLNVPFWQTMVSVLNTFFVVSIQLSAPCLVAILMAEMFLGIANRLAPQVQIAFLGMSFKSLLGIALLFVGWFFILTQLSKQAQIWLKTIQYVLQTIPT